MHFTSFRKGHFFKLVLTMKDKMGESSYLSAEELKLQFDRICEIADGKKVCIYV